MAAEWAQPLEIDKIDGFSGELDGYVKSFTKYLSRAGAEHSKLQRFKFGRLIVSGANPRLGRCALLYTD